VATHSKIVIESIIRERIGFRGLLMSDDLSMGALTGDLASRAAASIAAGCDVVLHCSGELKPGEAIAKSVPELEGDALRRATEALAMLTRPEPVDRVALEARFDALLARFAPKTPEVATA
jgi:beta-N-acetylhexosaminidase